MKILGGLIRIFSSFQAVNAPPRAGRFGMTGSVAFVTLLAVLCGALPSPAQRLAPTLPRNRRGPARTSRLVAQPVPVALPSVKPFAGRYVVLMLAGVSWADWAAISGGTFGSTPGLQRVLSEGDVAALRLPGAPTRERDEPSDRHGEFLAERSFLERSRISTPLLRASATLSSGEAIGWPNAGAPPIPLSAAATLGVNETWSAATPGYEDSSPASAYARRVAGWKTPDEEPKPGTMVNLAGSLWHGGETARESNLPHFGALGDALRRAGGRAVAFGSADTNLSSARSLPLREWALAACDSRGVISLGEVSPALLVSDSGAPFGVRQNGAALLSQVQGALTDPATGLITIEWGDTRRAALYAPLCAPGVAQSHQKLAIERADDFVRNVIKLLQPTDRLFVLSVPDIDSAHAQWMPAVYWQPSLVGRATLGRFLMAGAEHEGVAPLESVFSSIIARLGTTADMLPENPAPALGPSNTPPATASYRVGRLLALQSGWAWLDAARPVAHGIWAVFFFVSIVILVVLLSHAPAGGGFGTVSETPVGHLSSSQNWARAWWSATMVLPLLMWLGGLCIEATWRFGALPGLVGAPTDQSGWRLPIALMLIAGMMVGLAGLARTWFARARLRGVRVGLIYLLLTIVGLFIGGFALPWNSLIGQPVLEGAKERAGDIWALLLISATLLGVGGMAQPSQRSLSARTEYKSDDDQRPRRIRRVINLRPAALWMVAVLLILGMGGLGRNSGATFVAAIAFGTLWLRLWLERRHRPERLRKRRWVLAFALGVSFLLLLPQGMPTIENALADWWPRWLETWKLWWWNLALVATLLGAGAFLTSARIALRNYLRVRYAMRAMLAGAMSAAFASLIIFGSFGPPLIALYTLGAVIFQVLGAAPTTDRPTDA